VIGLLTTTRLRERIAELVAAASDGEIEPAEVLAAGATFSDLGMTSLFYLRLIDGLEREFDLEFDLEEGTTSLDTVEKLAALLAERGVVTSG
jgi:acyl carrier protein